MLFFVYSVLYTEHTHSTSAMTGFKSMLFFSTGYINISNNLLTLEIALTLDLVIGAFFVVYLFPTEEKGTCELRKENQRLTWENDLP